MKTELYFLRSSEQKVIVDFLPYAYKLDEIGKSLEDFSHLNVYKDYYGLSRKDLGLYALANKKIAGAVWARKLHDNQAPKIHMAILPELRSMGIGTQIMEQFLQEAGAVFEALEVDILVDCKAIMFYEKFGFTKVENSEQRSLIDGEIIITMLKKLEQKEVVRPKDNYNASYWMD